MLADHPFFDGFPREELERLAEQSQVRAFEVGEPIIGRGRPGQHVGVIIEGRVEVVGADAQGRATRLAELGEGDYFGEISLISGEPTTADVRASLPARVALIPHEALSAALTAHPAALRQLARTVSQRLRQQIAHQGGAPGAPMAPTEDPEPTEDVATTAQALVVQCTEGLLRYNFYDVEHEIYNREGRIEGLGAAEATHIDMGLREKTESRIDPVLPGALRVVLESLTEPHGSLGSPDGLSLVVHRITFGGERFTEPVLVDDEVATELREVAQAAPWETARAAETLELLREMLPDADHVAVFDTAFHQSLPPHAFLYALPYELYREEGLRRYGADGLAHHQAMLLAATHLGRLPEDLRLVTCDLSVRTSLCAISQGRAVDCTAGVSGLGGVPGPTTPGDLDPGILLRLQREGRDLKAVERLLTEGSGLNSLAGLEGGLTELALAAEGGHARATLALEIWAHQVKKHIGAYFAAMGGLDALVFTGIHAGVASLRRAVCAGLVGLGIDLDERANQGSEPSADGITELSGTWSRTQVLLVPTDTQRMAASEALKALGRSSLARAFATRRHPIPISISAHHLHLSQEDVEALYGEGHGLTVRLALSQPGQSACEEQVTLVGPRGAVERVRVLGPVRRETQVEISRTDEFKLGIDAPVRASGDTDGSPGLRLEGTAGSLELSQGVICAARHVHMSPEDALRFGVRDKDMITVCVEGERPVSFRDVLVRVHPDFRLDMHVDTDEGNAAELDRGAVGYVESVKRGS